MFLRKHTQNPLADAIFGLRKLQHQLPSAPRWQAFELSAGRFFPGDLMLSLRNSAMPCPAMPCHALPCPACRHKNQFGIAGLCSVKRKPCQRLMLHEEWVPVCVPTTPTTATRPTSGCMVKSSQRMVILSTLAKLISSPQQYQTLSAAITLHA